MQLKKEVKGLKSLEKGGCVVRDWVLGNTQQYCISLGNVNYTIFIVKKKCKNNFHSEIDRKCHH